MDVGARQVLLRMKAELSKGWTQGQLLSADGVCLYGALVRGCHLPMCKTPRDCGTAVEGRYSDADDAVAHFYVKRDSDEGRAIQLLANEARVPLEKLALWNDEPGRTDTDVIELIDRALERDAAASEYPVVEQVLAR